MVQGFLSPDWYRVAALRPRIHLQVDLHRQIFRSEPWTVVQDHQSGKLNRLTPQAAFIFARMDGRRTVHELWEDACARFEDAPPSQMDVIRLISQLYQADLIAGDRAPDLQELTRRAARQAAQQKMARLRNPLAIQLPLFDPSAVLQRLRGLTDPVFTPAFAVLWVAMMLTALILGATHWSDLTDDFSGRVLNASNVFLMLLAYPIMKAAHEFGHAAAVTHWGGEVHEAGLMFLVFMPLPYVDASASGAFASKWQRVAVGAAGILVEMTLAALALGVWLGAEPGLLRAFAYDVMMLGGVSTLLVNGNPLLRFDGYFILSDLIEVPNLGTRSNRYVWHLVDRYLLGNRHSETPVAVPSERGWMLFYAVGSFIYRMLVLAAVSLLVAGQFLIVGLALAAVGLVAALGLPVLRGLRHVLFSAVLARSRLRAVLVTAGGIGGLAALLFGLPVAHVKVVPAVVWAGPEATLRAQASGFVAEVLVRPQQRVQAGDAVLRLDDPDIEARITVAKAELEQARLELLAAQAVDRVQAAILAQQVVLAEKELARLKDLAAKLTVVALASGEVVIPNALDLQGRLMREGEAFGFVWQGKASEVRVAVDQSTGELLGAGSGVAELRFERDLDHAIPARLAHAVPEASLQVPSGALSTQGGGDIELDPSDAQQTRALERVFIFTFALDRPAEGALLGERALLRLDLGQDTVGDRILRLLRQVFLRHFWH
jgi:putative peptide zinc metalloprotease protein